MDQQSRSYGLPTAPSANQMRHGGGGGVFMHTPRCLGTSPYVFPGKRHALSSNMLLESVSLKFPLFPDPISLNTGAPAAPQLSFLLIPFSDVFHTSGKVEHSPAP